MPTLTATPDPILGTVTLTIDNATGVTAILRADSNGVRNVRLRELELPASAGITITDYEPAIAGRIRYRLVGVTAEDVWTEIGAILPRFNLPALPASPIIVENVHGYTADRTSRSTVHTIIGRPSPIVAEGRLSLRTGRLDVWFDEYSGARDLEAMLERGQAVLYRQAEHPGMDMFFHPLDVAVSPDETAWRLTLGYLEVDPPAGYVLGLKSWTFARLASDGGTFDQVRTDYRSFAALSRNDAGA